MAKKLDRSEVEYLRGVVRSQKAEIKHLKKELGRLQKRSRDVEDLEELLQEQQEEQQAEAFHAPVRVCTKCRDGRHLVISDLGAKTRIFCNSCGHGEMIK